MDAQVTLQDVGKQFVLQAGAANDGDKGVRSATTFTIVQDVFQGFQVWPPNAYSNDGPGCFGLWSVIVWDRRAPCSPTRQSSQSALTMEYKWMKCK
jgi:hypothetical protein